MAEAPRMEPRFFKKKVAIGVSGEGSSLTVEIASAASGINETRLHGDLKIAGENDNRPRRH